MGTKELILSPLNHSHNETILWQRQGLNSQPPEQELTDLTDVINRNERKKERMKEKKKERKDDTD